MTLNALIFLTASQAGMLPASVGLPPQGAPLILSQVLLASGVGTLLATLAFAMVARLSRRPVQTFTWVAALALLASFASPLGIAGAPLAMRLTLDVMHVVVAAVSVALITRTFGPSQSRL